jgi:hypothetical protein
MVAGASKRLISTRCGGDGFFRTNGERQKTAESIVSNAETHFSIVVP